MALPRCPREGGSAMLSMRGKLDAKNDQHFPRAEGHAPPRERCGLPVHGAQPAVFPGVCHLPDGHVSGDQHVQLHHDRLQLHRASKLRRALLGRHLWKVPRQHRHHRAHQRAHRMLLLAVGGVGHLQAPGRVHLVLPLRVLPARRHRLGGRDGGVEVDVQPLLRPAQLRL